MKNVLLLMFVALLGVMIITCCRDVNPKHAPENNTLDGTLIGNETNGEGLGGFTFEEGTEDGFQGE